MKDHSEGPEYAPYLHELRSEVDRFMSIVSDLAESGRSRDELKAFESRLRFWLNGTMIPSVIALTCLIYLEAEAGNAGRSIDTLNNIARYLIPNVAAHPLSGDSAFLEERSKEVHPQEHEFIAENLGSLEILSRQSFDSVVSQFLQS